MRRHDCLSESKVTKACRYVYTYKIFPIKQELFQVILGESLPLPFNNLNALFLIYSAFFPIFSNDIRN